MVDFALLSFSFLQGVIAFFAPCAVALLPGYISRYVVQKQEKAHWSVLARRAFVIAGLMILGFLAIYGVAGILIVLISQTVKTYMPYIVIGMGGLIIILGILMMLGKNVAIPVHLQMKDKHNQYVESFLFGIVYGLGALGCLFPLFLVVATSALAAPTLLEGSLYLIAYFVGMSLFMLLFAFFAVFAREFLMAKMRAFMPYITRVSGALIIAAGIYIIQYQWVLI